MAKSFSFEEGKKSFLANLQRPLQANTTPTGVPLQQPGVPLQQPFQSMGVRGVAKGATSQPLRAITDSQKPGVKNE